VLIYLAAYFERPSVLCARSGEAEAAGGGAEWIASPTVCAVAVLPETRYAGENVSIAYQVMGAGDADIVLISESVFPIEALHYEPTIAAFLTRLASWGRLVLFDRRGVGLSDPVSATSPPTLEDWVLDGLTVLDAVGSSQPAVIATGASAGLVALLLAASHPDRVRSLVLYDAMARYRWAPDYPWGVSPELERDLIEQVRHTWGSTRIVDRRGRLEATVAKRPEVANWAVEWARRGASPTTAMLLNHVSHNSDLRGLLGSISAPTLILNHADSEDGRFLAKRIMHARYLELDDPVHFIFSSQIDDISAAMSELIVGRPMAPPSSRVLATLLFTDIVGSTQQLSAIGDRRWRELLDRHDHMVRRQLGRFDRRLITTTGDGFLATFDGPARAVQCALAVRDGARQQNITIRAGLHTGEVELRGDDIAGLAVHVGQRISSLAEDDEILVSRTVVDLVAGSDLAFDARGERQLKGLAGSWPVFAVSTTPV
jgi:class 3 adenylate cyclase